MQIALFGGSFDPPHLAHQSIPRTMISEKIVDQVWYVPVKQHPFKKPLSSDEHRLAMLKLLLSPDFPQICIEEYELHRPVVSYTIETLEFFAQKYPEDTFSWVIGSDNLEKFHLWGRYQEILKKFSVFVYPRHGYPLTSLLPGMVPLTQLPEVEVSSTQVRQMVAKSEAVQEFVIPAVAEYIQAHHLYQ